MNNNRRFAELVNPGKDCTYHPDFTDAKEVLKVMRKMCDDRGRSWPRFRDYLMTEGYKIDPVRHELTNLVDLILDTTGKLRDLAIAWMEGRKEAAK